MTASIVRSFAHSYIMKDTQTQCNWLIKYEGRIIWICLPKITDFVLANAIVFDFVKIISWVIIFSKFPVSYQIRIIKWVISVHSEYFILYLGESMILFEHLKFFHESSKTLGLLVWKCTNIYNILHTWIFHIILGVIKTSTLNLSHICVWNC